MTKLNEIGEYILTTTLGFNLTSKPSYHFVEEGAIMKAGKVTLLLYDFTKDANLSSSWSNDSESSKNRGVITRTLEGRIGNIQRSLQHYHRRGIHTTEEGNYGWISLADNS